MKVCDYIVDFLNKKNIHTMFGYIGGYNADIIDAFCQKQENRFVLNYHEQAAAFAVNTYAIISEQVAVVTASGAPSSCNLVAGIANAYFDSNPCLFLVGSVHSLAVRESNKIRQNGFEEVDMVSLVAGITKYAVKITDANDIMYELEKAFYIASSGRKGPVLVDIPYDIARMDIAGDNMRRFDIPTLSEYDELDFAAVMALLNKAKRPVVLLGGGTRSAMCRKSIKQLLNKVKIPMVASLCGIDVLSHDNECYSGFIGHYGNRYANLAVANCDLLIVLGSRLDERQLGGFYTKLDDARIIRVDIDKHELGRKLPETLSYYSSAEDFLAEFVKQDFSHCDFTKWLSVIALWKQRYPSLDNYKTVVSALDLLHEISDYLPRNALICADVGQNQMCAAQALRLDGDRRMFNSAGYGSMGFSLPAAIGCAYAEPKTCVLSINGDGGIQMNIQELHTIKRDNLPVNIIVLNNNCLGMIRKTQANLFNSRNYVSVDGYSAPNFKELARAYDIPYIRIDSVDKYIDVKDFISSEQPRFIEVILPLQMDNSPEPGASIEKQSPLLSDIEYAQIKGECES